MTTATARAGHLRSTVGTTLAAIALVTAIGGLSPAFGQNRGWGPEQHERGRHERDWRDDRGRRAHRPVYGPRVYAPVYAPPPVVYVPAPSVGVHLFFPLFH